MAEHKLCLQLSRYRYEKQVFRCKYDFGQPSLDFDLSHIPHDKHFTISIHNVQHFTNNDNDR